MIDARGLQTAYQILACSSPTRTNVFKLRCCDQYHWNRGCGVGEAFWVKEPFNEMRSFLKKFMRIPCWVSAQPNTCQHSLI